MSKNESRRERRKQANNTNNEPNSNKGPGISKVYYWIIGGLFLILLLLIIFIFSRSGDDVNLGEEDQTSIVQDSETESNETEETEETEQPTEEQEENEDPETEEPEEDTEDDQEDTDEEESTTVDEDAPLDESHAVDYSDGSSDRTAIKSQIMQATGLNDNLIEWWVGNNGPGQVVANVSNAEQTEHYEVYLQYGDGSWHVTSYEELAENPGS